MFTSVKDQSDEMVIGGQQQGINMSKDEILAYLQEVQDLNAKTERRGRTFGGSMDNLSLRQKYLEHVTNNPKANEKYFTMLGEMLIDNCFSLHPSSLTSNPKDKAQNARIILQNFLE